MLLMVLFSNSYREQLYLCFFNYLAYLSSKLLGQFCYSSIPLLYQNKTRYVYLFEFFEY